MKKTISLLSLIIALTTSASATERTPAEAEAVLLRGMENIGRILQNSEQCAVSRTHLRGFIANYDATFRLAEVMGHPSADQLEQAYETGREAAIARPSSKAGCDFFRNGIAELDAGQAEIAKAIRKYLAKQKN